jgi:outer membrane protein OmpA-like peptidoglycan-associated protein
MRALLFSSLFILASTSWAQDPTTPPVAGPATQPVQTYDRPAENRPVVVSTYCPIIVDRVLFSRGSAAIPKEDFIVLDAIAKVLNENPTIILLEVQGHVDPTTEGLYGEKLSLKRANAAKDYLVSQGVDPERLMARGYASKLPLTNGKYAKDRAKNRRIEFEVLKKAE